MERGYSGFSVEEILLLIGIQGRTGELVLEAGNNIGTVLFHRGDILHAFSPYSKAIGDLFVEDGVITEGELLEFLKMQKTGEVYVPLGALLVRHGRVTFEVVEALVQQQIRESVKEFTNWKNLSTSFINKPISPFDDIKLAVHEFIDRESLKIALDSLSRMNEKKNASAAPASHQA